jgi:hypothetical protein
MAFKERRALAGEPLAATVEFDMDTSFLLERLFHLAKSRIDGNARGQIHSPRQPGLRRT